MPADSGRGHGPASADLTRPRRLSPLTPLVRGFIVVLAAFLTSWDNVLTGDIGPLSLMFGVLLVGGAVYGVASWYLTSFWIGPEELRIDTGVVHRQSRRIRIDRIQGIDIVQPFVARLFGLAELRMDVAGGSSREGSLAFLPLAEADEVREVLLARRDSGSPEASPPTGTGSGAQRPGQQPVPEHELGKVQLPLLVASTLLSGETVALVLGAAVLVGVFLATGEWVALSAVFPAMVALALVLGRKLAGNYGFTVSEGRTGLRVRRGLFDLNTQTIALARLQGVVVTEPWLWRGLGWARLDVSIAGYAGADSNGPAPSTVLPVGPRAQVLALADHVLAGAGVDGADPAAVPTSPSAPRARWVAPVRRRYLRAGADTRLAVSRRGVLSRHLHAVPHARVQSVRLRQGPVDRLLGLATVRVDSPPGPVSVRAEHRAAHEARTILEREVAASRRARLALAAARARWADSTWPETTSLSGEPERNG